MGIYCGGHEGMPRDICAGTGRAPYCSLDGETWQAMSSLPECSGFIWTAAYMEL